MQPWVELRLHELFAIVSCTWYACRGICRGMTQSASASTAQWCIIASRIVPTLGDRSYMDSILDYGLENGPNSGDKLVFSLVLRADLDNQVCSKHAVRLKAHHHWGHRAMAAFLIGCLFLALALILSPVWLPSPAKPYYLIHSVFWGNGQGSTSNHIEWWYIVCQVISFSYR